MTSYPREHQEVLVSKSNFNGTFPQEGTMASYWWECSHCGSRFEFKDVCESRGITHYIWDVLIPSGWEQSHLIKTCFQCNNGDMGITYVFPQADQTHIRVKHIVGIGPFDKYVPMMWETIPDGNNEETWIDFKYINGRNMWGLNKPAVFSKEDIKKLFQLYRNRTPDKNFPL